MTKLGVLNTLNDPPLISICIITYNHSAYITKAIEGVLLQEGDLNWELVISNDFSKDDTNEIIIQYLSKNYKGDRVKYFSHDKNLGAIPNFIFALKQCTGKYIAICDGDDYWTNSLKLQAQIAFLEANLEYSLCFHNVLVKHEGVVGADYLFCKDIPNDTSIRNVIRDWYIPTASMVFRKQLILPLPAWFDNIYNGDYALQLLLADKGKIKYIDEVMGVYRKQKGGLNSAVQNKIIWQHKIALMNYFNIHTNFKYNSLIQERTHLLFEEFEQIVSGRKHFLAKVFSISVWKKKLASYLIVK